LVVDIAQKAGKVRVPVKPVVIKKRKYSVQGSPK